MKLEGILHLNIRCPVADLPKIEKFYDEVVGLKKGHRPDFGSPGLWLYAGDEPLVHVGTRVAKGFLVEKHNGSVDHIAFRMKGATEFRTHVRKTGVSFEESNVPGAGYQIFLKDPIGTVLEFNFPNSEAPQDVTSGTMAPRIRATV